MSATYEDVGALLVKWRKSKQPITVLFSSEADNWRRSGKITDVYFGTFDVEWDDGNSEPISYTAVAHISEDGRSLNLLYTADGSTVVVFEEAS